MKLLTRPVEYVAGRPLPQRRRSWALIMQDCAVRARSRAAVTWYGEILTPHGTVYGPVDPHVDPFTLLPAGHPGVWDMHDPAEWRDRRGADPVRWLALQIAGTVQSELIDVAPSWVAVHPIVSAVSDAAVWLTAVVDAPDAVVDALRPVLAADTAGMVPPEPDVNAPARAAFTFTPCQGYK